MRRHPLLLLTLPLILGAGEPPSPAAPLSPRDQAVQRGVAFLVKDQNPEGSWGSFKTSLHWEVFWSNPETHRAWRVATTGLCCMALMTHEKQPGATEALARGVDYLLHNADLKRPNNWDTDNIWGLVFGLEALARAERHPGLASRREAIRPVVDGLLRALAASETPSGGWGYYDFNGPATFPGSWATAFTTASAVLALREAREAGHVLPPGVMETSLEALERSRLPDGAYTYSVSAIARPTPGSEDIHNPKGSLSRIQVCNLARFLEKSGVAEADLRAGLDRFFKDHKFLEIACCRPIPHEAYYYNAGYFFLYGHAYAARTIRCLPEAAQAPYRKQLEDILLKLQTPDGSWWDFTMQGYAKPYGTAFTLIALAP